MKLAYEAYNQRGHIVRGALEAADAADVTEKLYQQGLYVTRVRRAPAERSAGGWRPGSGGPSARGLKQLTALTKQLAVLCSTGTPVVQALAAVERQLPEGAWHSVMGDVRRRVEEGEPLSEAMLKHPRTFGPVYRSLIAAGESGGQLATMLERLAVMTRQQARVRNTLAAAMTYPALLVVISVVVVGVMLTVVLPRFAGLFETLDAPIPPSTKALMALSAALRGYWWAFLAGAAACGAAAAVWARTPSARRVLEFVLVHGPLVGGLTRKLTTARIARVLGYLLDGRVPMLDALRLTREAAGNAAYAGLIARAEEAVTHGDSLSAVLRQTPLIAPSVSEAVATGERTGQLAPILLNLADFMDEDNEVAVKSLTGLLEPLILIVLGGVVGFVAFSMFMPMFDLTAAAQGGP